jgi:hypothetical protein
MSECDMHETDAVHLCESLCLQMWYWACLAGDYTLSATKEHAFRQKHHTLHLCLSRLGILGLQHLLSSAHSSPCLTRHHMLNAFTHPTSFQSTLE